MAEKQCNLIKNGGGTEQVESVTVKDVNNNDVVIYKCGRIIQFYVNTSYNVPHATYPIILTLPVGYRPTSNIAISANANSSTIGNQAMDITTTGEVRLNGYLSSGNVYIHELVVFMIT